MTNISKLGAGFTELSQIECFKNHAKTPRTSGEITDKGSWDFELIDELKPVAGDIFIEKPRYSGFFNTALDSMLRARGIRNLVFVGIATNVCVESTLRDGFFLEYFGVTLDDACYQAGPKEAHLAALYNIQTFFGWVSNTASFMATFQPQTHSKTLSKSA